MVRKLVLSLIAVLGVMAFAIAQNKQISGTVVGTDGTPVIGASVVVAGTNAGATTTVDGSFTVNAPVNGTLIISFLGMETQSVAINNQTNIAVTLAEDSKKIDDVIVVAFGTAKKEAFTGSVAIVKSEEIAKTQTSNVAQVLAGAAPGVQLANTSGQPGSAPSVMIRGLGSLSSTTAPLWVVDGIPYDGDLSLINPNDIETMTVLKDAASTALYGSRGSNGVIMVTTKKGRMGQAIITVDAKVGVNSRAVKNYDYISNPAMYYETVYDAINKYAKGTLSYDDATAHAYSNQELIKSLGYQVYSVPDGQNFIGMNGKVNPNATLGNYYQSSDGNTYYLTPDDWEDEAFDTSVRQEYNVNVSAATDRSNFYLSFGYLNDKGIIENSYMKRYTARLRGDYQVKKWLKVGANVGYSNYDGQGVSEGASGSSVSTTNIFGVIALAAPIYPLYVRDANRKIMKDKYGNTRYDYGSGSSGDGGISGLVRPVMTGSNAVGSNELDIDNKYDGNSLTANGFAEATIIDGLKFTFNAGVMFDETRGSTLINPFYGGYASQNGIIDKRHGRFFAFNMQEILNYSKKFGRHNVDVMIGHENYQRNQAALTASKSNMFDPSILELDAAIINGSASSYSTGYNTEGYFGRVQYDYAGKYFVNGSYRRDASSRFDPAYRWGNFWSVGAAWMVTNETFMAGTRSWLDMLKFKVSYGSQGNDGIGNFRYTNMFSLESAGGDLASPFNTKGNRVISWETNGNLNVGIDFSLFHGRLSGGVEYFYRNTTDMLFRRPVAPSTGYSSYVDNIGDMVNKGIEITLDGVLLATKNVTWTARLNMTHFKNEITRLPPEKMLTNGYVDGDYWLTEGSPRYSWYMRRFAGVDQTTGKALYYKWKDAEDHSQGMETTTDFEAGDRMIIGKEATPDLYGGFGTAVNFYGFDLSVNFTYSIGGYAMDYGYFRSMSSPSFAGGNNIHRDMLKSWTPQNKSQDYPRMYYQDMYWAGYTDRFLTDASYLNLQNINFGYTFKPEWMRKIHVESLRVYLSCENVYYWSKRQGLDPRQNFSGQTNDTLYSPLRVISGGVTVRF